jgi:hypothetical protein
LRSAEPGYAGLSIFTLWPIKNPHHCVVRVIFIGGGGGN